MPYIAWKTPLTMKWHRVAKFKQRAQLEKNPRLRAIPSLAGGACVGLSFVWLSRHLQFPAESATGRCAFLSRGDTWFLIERHCSAFNTTLTLDNTRRIQINLPNICGRSSTSSIEARGREGLKTLVQHVKNTQPGYYIWLMDFECGGSGHMCAFHANSKHLRFFDANSGEYLIHADRASDFFKQLYTHYLNYLSGAGVRKELKFDEHCLVQMGT